MNFQIEAHFWHPVCDTHDLLHAPLPTQVLGHDVVLWRDLQGKAQALHDQCPHRGAKLSLGQVCQGALQCPYHGWTFQGSGQCVNIPAMPDFTPSAAQQARAVAVQEA